MEAQTISPALSGEYYLKGVRETAAGFQLKPDSTFQFFFSYGALDRYGEGRWSVKNNMVVLNSRPKPTRDFALKQSATGAKENISIQIRDENAVLLRYVHCKITGGNQTQERTTNEKGRIEFAAQPVDTVELVFEFCPEKKSLFTVDTIEHHSFEFTIEPWLMEVFFQNFCLLQTATGLEGRLPLAEENTSYQYEKRSH